jgi:23S rRNA (uracil1939-C5)-methyltransferase
MKKLISEVVSLTKLVPGGQALGRLADGRAIFVWNALPDEKVVVQITKSKKSYAEGVAIEILEPSPLRAKPRDECYLSTSPWQMMTFEAEQAFKAELVQESFSQEGIELSSPTIVTDGRDYFYRNKMEYSLWWDHETSKISLAFHRRGSHQKIPITRSSIEQPEIFTEAQKIVTELNASGAEARTYQSLLMRANQQGEVSGALLENGKPHPVMNNLTDEILDRRYSYSPNGFFQINLPMYELALQDIARHLGDSQKVVDMYAGVGTIGLSVAADRELTLVETDASAFRELENNISTGAKNIHAVHAKSEDALTHITPDATLIVDPPRAGLDETVIARILETQPQKVIYLSCNPTTQARDTAKLLEKYKITHHQGYNFFPRTPHIEHLLVFSMR